MRRTLERWFAGIAIENLSLFLTVVIGLVSALAQFVEPTLGVVTYERVFVQGEFWHLLVFPFRMAVYDADSGGMIWLMLFVYVFWLFATQLESQEGAVTFTAFVVTGIVTILVGHLVGDYFFAAAVDAYFLDLAIFAAVAYLNPEQRILLFFIIPVKLKWIAAIIFGGMLIVATVQATQIYSLVPYWSPAFGMASFLIFYGPEWARRFVHTGRHRVRRASFEARAAVVTIHRCTVCGLTERDDPSMDFRFCVDCDDHEYCAIHLVDHAHIRKSPT